MESRNERMRYQVSEGDPQGQPGPDPTVPTTRSPESPMDEPAEDDAVEDFGDEVNESETPSPGG